MRVLIIRNSFEYNFGGAEKLAVSFATELVANKAEVLVITKQQKLLAHAASKNIPHKKGPWWSMQNWSGARLLLLPLYFIWLLYLTGWYTWLILRTQADVVHLMSKDDFIAGSIAAKILNRGVVWTDCADLKFLYRNHTVWYKNPVGKLVFVVAKLADTITLVSKNEKRLIELEIDAKLGPQYKVMYTVGSDENIEPIHLANSRGGVVFCATSRLVLDKGIQELILAFNNLKRQKYKLWLVGDGPDAKMFHKLAEGNKNIIFFGHKNNPLSYLAAADIYVHPTHHEGFSLGLAEAAMLSKPMIATAVGGNPELVNSSNGVLVPAKDVPALTEAMLALASDELLYKRLGQQARKDFLRKFNLSKVVAEELLPIYEKACN